MGLLVFTAIPFGASLYLSFTDYSLMDSPVWVGLENFERLFTRDRTFMKSLWVTLAYVGLTVPLKLAFALFIAVILNSKIRAIGFFRTAYYVPSILGGSIAIAVLWRYIFSDTGLVNMAIGMVGLEPINWFGDPTNALFTITLLRVWQFGSAMVIFLAALQAVDKSLYEAASIDGAGKWSSFRHITLPLLTPVIFFNLIMQMVQAFQEFNGPYVITGADRSSPPTSCPSTSTTKPSNPSTWATPPPSPGCSSSSSWRSPWSRSGRRRSGSTTPATRGADSHDTRPRPRKGGPARQRAQPPHRTDWHLHSLRAPDRRRHPDALSADLACRRLVQDQCRYLREPGLHPRNPTLDGYIQGWQTSTPIPSPASSGIPS